MLLRPHLQLLRGRLIWAVALTLAVVRLEFMIVASDTFSLRIFWDQACTCPVAPSDARILIDVGISFAFLGGILGYLSGNGTVAQGAAQPGALRFMLTRPDSRLNLILAPFLICAVAIVALPALAWALLLGWLHMVHAPALGHLLLALETIPGASQLGPHPTFSALAAATHMGRFYLAGISIGLCVYVFLNSSRWLMQSRFVSLKILGVFSSVFVFALAFALKFAWIRSLFFAPVHHSDVTYLPSELAIVLHFAFVAAYFYGTLWIMRDLEI
jgi:hypothetical protein